MKSKKRKKKAKIKKNKKKISFNKNDNLDIEPVFKVSKLWAKKAYVDKSSYEKKYKLSLKKK